MGRKKIENIIKDKISPHSLSDTGKSKVAQLIRNYPYELLVECIDIAVAKYFRYDRNGVLKQESAEEFINKLGGIAYNKSRTPIEQEIYYLKTKGNKYFPYWDNNRADELLHEYVNELFLKGWNESMIVSDLKGESTRMMNNSTSWTDWKTHLISWIEDIKKLANDDNSYIKQSGSILPFDLYNKLPSNIQSLCNQMNASYENNLFDCTAVIMRRLLESLLVLSYQKYGIEEEIMNGNFHVTLDKMIKNAEQNKTLSLSSNTKKDMSLFKDLGNYSAHKIWYNCTQGDIKPHILKYRVIIEELMYKSGIK